MAEGESDEQQPQSSASALSNQLSRLNMQQYKTQPKDHYAFWATQPVAQFTEQDPEQVRPQALQSWEGQIALLPLLPAPRMSC